MKITFRLPCPDAIVAERQLPKWMHVLGFGMQADDSIVTCNL
jgi:hypothetical protein